MLLHTDRKPVFVVVVIVVGLFLGEHFDLSLVIDAAGGGLGRGGRGVGAPHLRADRGVHLVPCAIRGGYYFVVKRRSLRTRHAALNRTSSQVAPSVSRARPRAWQPSTTAVATFCETRDEARARSLVCTCGLLFPLAVRRHPLPSGGRHTPNNNRGTRLRDGADPVDRGHYAVLSELLLAQRVRDRLRSRSFVSSFGCFVVLLFGFVVVVAVAVVVGQSFVFLWLRRGVGGGW